METGTIVGQYFRKEEQQGPSQGHQGATERRKNPKKHQDFKIPLISKKMNSVEKYISIFDDRQDYHRDDLDSSSAKSKYQDHATNRQLLNHHRSVDVYALSNTSQETGNCVKYSPIVNECSEERLEKLLKLQKDYSLLKQKLHPHRKNYTGDGSMIKSSRRFEKARPQHITEEEVEKELKNTVVNQNGQKYFADLYLLKKGRESIMNSLSNAGKFALNNNSDPMSLSQFLGKMTYEEKLKANEKDFVSGKIIEERQAKRNKMMKGRNLHWNVYYDMLALSASQRQKLKGLCKFSSTFGIS